MRLNTLFGATAKAKPRKCRFVSTISQTAGKSHTRALFLGKKPPKPFVSNATTSLPPCCSLCTLGSRYQTPKTRKRLKKRHHPVFSCWALSVLL